jgi:hypothetical protein
MPLAVVGELYVYNVLTNWDKPKLLVMKVCLGVETRVRAFGISSLLIVFTVLILDRSNLYRQCQLDRRATCIMTYVYDW